MIHRSCFFGKTKRRTSIEQLETYAQKQAELCKKYGSIEPELYNIHGVKRGLRDVNGQGVVTGLTNISKITAFQTIDGEKVPCDGELLYRGYDVKDLIAGMA